MNELDIIESTPSTSNDSFGIDDSLQNDRPVSVDSQDFSIITEQMKAEEKLIAEEIAKEEEELKQQYEENLKTDEQELRYNRLMVLLTKSKLYSDFLQNRLNSKVTEKKTENKAVNVKPVSELDSKTLLEKDLNVEGLKDTKSRCYESALTPTKTSSRKRKANSSYTKDYVVDFKVNLLKRRTVSTDEFNDAENNGPDGCNNNIYRNSGKGKESDNNAATKITSLGLEVPVEQPDLVEGGILRDYQLEGIEWLKLRYESGMNGILADEMGLGKTIQIIAYICLLISKGVKGPYLIVAPLSTLSNWILEFERFAPQIPVVLFHGPQNERRTLYRSFYEVRQVDKYFTKPVIVTSYEIPLKEHKALSKVEWSYLIVDEGHRLKNSISLLSRKLRTLPTKNRLLLTGTPLQNNLTELWSLLNFLLPEIFDDLSTFETWFDVQEMENAEGAEKIIEQEREQKVISSLHQILQPFLLRRMKSDIVLEIPPKKEVMVYCPMTDIQMEMYKCIVDKTIKSLSNEVELDSPKRRTTSKYRKEIPPVKVTEYFPLESMPACRKLTNRLGATDKQRRSCFINRLPLQNPTVVLKHIVNHPYLVRMPVTYSDKGKAMLRVTEHVKTVSGKLLVLDAMLAKLKERGHKVLIFCTSSMMLDILEEYMILAKYTYLRLDGSTRILNRKQDIYAFNTDPNIFVFLLTNRAGGLGINLVGADTVILYNSDWNPQADLQAQDRAHRIGQTKPVVVYRFNVAGTVDEKIISRASSKRKLEKIVMKYGAFTPGNRNSYIDLQELRELLKETDTHKQMHSNGFVFTNKELEELLDRSDLMEGNSKEVHEEKLGSASESRNKADSNSRKTTRRKVYQIVDFQSSNVK